MISSHANVAQGVTNFVGLTYYQFVWVWNSKQTLEGVNTDVNQNQKKVCTTPWELKLIFLYCSCLKKKCIKK